MQPGPLDGRGPPSPSQPSLPSCIQSPGWTPRPPRAARNQARPSSKPGPLQGAAGGSGSSAVRAPCGFLNAGCQEQVYFGLCILHRAGQQPGSTAGEVSTSTQHGQPSGSGVCSITGHGGRIPRLGSDHDSAKISPPPTQRPTEKAQAWDGHSGPGSRDEADPGDKTVNQRGNKQKEDSDRGPRQTERGCHSEPRGRGAGGRPR